ncbi:MAG: hypothetical protein JXR42_01475 [Gammaproteobacteria bacterium]|nr:hypothetical protein [Gammaproteobacteria bacterium]
MSVVCYALGDYTDALEHSDKASDMFQEITSQQDDQLQWKINRAIALHNHSQILFALGNRIEALEYSNLVLSAMRSLSLGDAAQISDVFLSNRAEILYAMGEFSDAMNILPEDVDVINRKARSTENQHYLAINLYRKGLILYGRGSYKNAIEHGKTGLKLAEKSRYPWNVVASIRTLLGNAHYKLGEYKEARVHHVAARELSEFVGRLAHPRLFENLLALAEIDYFMGDMDSSQRFISALYSIEVSVYQDYLPDYSYAKGRVKYLMENYGRAIKDIESVKLKLVELDRENYPFLLSCYETLGDINYDLEKFNDARSFYEQILSIGTNRTSLHPALVAVRSKLGACQLALGELEFARLTFSGVISAQQRGADDLVGKNIHPLDLADSYYHMSVLCIREQKYKSALNYAAQSYYLRNGYNKVISKHIANIWEKLGDVFLVLDKLSTAIVCYKEAQKIFKKLYGKDAKDTRSVNHKHECVGKLKGAIKGGIRVEVAKAKKDVAEIFISIVFGLQAVDDLHGIIGVFLLKFDSNSVQMADVYLSVARSLSNQGVRTGQTLAYYRNAARIYAEQSDDRYTSQIEEINKKIVELERSPAPDRSVAGDDYNARASDEGFFGSSMEKVVSDSCEDTVKPD